MTEPEELELTTSEAAVEVEGVWRAAGLALIRNPIGLLSLLFLAGAVLIAAFAPWIAPHDPNTISLANRLLPPSFADGSPDHLLGTDQIGKDILSRIIYGARLSLAIGGLAMLISAAGGASLGLAAGYFGGAIDAVVMRLADVQLAFPFILLAIIIIGVLGPSLPNVVTVLALSGWVQFARVVRVETLSLRERPFIEATRILGATHVAILARHLFPNVLPSLIVLATLELGRVIILESGLTFLGLGIPPPAVTWGSMLADGRNYVREAWWLSVFPGLALMLVVLAINLAGDTLRNVLDPTLKE
jgi:peptide/nickel transport system permease protein